MLLASWIGSLKLKVHLLATSILVAPVTISCFNANCTTRIQAYVVVARRHKQHAVVGRAQMEQSVHGITRCQGILPREADHQVTSFKTYVDLGIVYEAVSCEFYGHFLYLFRIREYSVNVAVTNHHRGGFIKTALRAQQKALDIMPDSSEVVLELIIAHVVMQNEVMLEPGQRQVADARAGARAPELW